MIKTLAARIPGRIKRQLRVLRNPPTAIAQPQPTPDISLTQPMDLMGVANPTLAYRETLKEVALKVGLVLEIGPYFRPVLVGNNVSYFDVRTSAELTERAELEGYSTEAIPTVDYVSPIGDLSVVDKKFDAVLSAHCIEHQPDFVDHLNKVGSLLNPAGRYYVIIPDKRYCFDNKIPESSIAQIISAHLEKRKVHSPQSVIEHRALTTHNDPLRHWQNDNDDIALDSAYVERIRSSIVEWRSSNGSYVDVHAWQFTPLSFKSIVNTLTQLDMIKLQLEAVFETPFPRNEFIAILKAV